MDSEQVSNQLRSCCSVIIGQNREHILNKVRKTVCEETKLLFLEKFFGTDYRSNQLDVCVCMIEILENET